MGNPFAGWNSPPSILQLSGDEVHVWGWSVAGGVEDLPLVHATLSTDELARMRAFRFAPDAERYARSRAGLRGILGQYLGVEPAGVRFVYGEHGKPGLAEGQADIEFNLSHTQEIAVAALSATGPVGIDVEDMRPVSRTLGEAVFSKRELNALQEPSSEQYAEAFFNGWTRKEAICKAEGMGFHLSSEAFSVSMLPGKEAYVLDAGGVLTRDWKLMTLAFGEGTVGALASSTAPSSVSLFRFDDQLLLERIDPQPLGIW